MSESKKFDAKNAKASLLKLGVQLRRYSLAIFLTIVGLTYSFIIFQINSLSSAQPSPDAVSSQIKGTQAPKIDPQLVQQLESLQDNSVNVQTLFDQARSNPFQ